MLSVANIPQCSLEHLCKQFSSKFLTFSLRANHLPTFLSPKAKDFQPNELSTIYNLASISIKVKPRTQDAFLMEPTARKNSNPLTDDSTPSIHAPIITSLISSALLLVSLPFSISPITIFTTLATSPLSTLMLSMFVLANSTQTPASSTSIFELYSWSAMMGHPMIGTPWLKLSSTEFHLQWLEISMHGMYLCVRFFKFLEERFELYLVLQIRFYCSGSRASGASLVARATIGSHMVALYALAMIQFNGSRGSKHDKDLHTGVALCAYAAKLGHVDAFCKIGHFLQDGWGTMGEGGGKVVEPCR